eukprot:scaffold770_cov109-Cylindrotheca_fusiformis.AAC.19
MIVRILAGSHPDYTDTPYKSRESVTYRLYSWWRMRDSPSQPTTDAVSSVDQEDEFTMIRTFQRAKLHGNGIHPGIE